MRKILASLDASLTLDCTDGLETLDSRESQQVVGGVVNTGADGNLHLASKVSMQDFHFVM